MDMGEAGKNRRNVRLTRKGRKRRKRKGCRVDMNVWSIPNGRQEGIDEKEEGRQEEKRERKKRDARCFLFFWLLFVAFCRKRERVSADKVIEQKESLSQGSVCPPAHQLHVMQTVLTIHTHRGGFSLGPILCIALPCLALPCMFGWMDARTTKCGRANVFCSRSWIVAND